MDPGSYLPACEARLAQEMSTGLDTGVLIPLCANLTKLEGAANVTIELILLLLGGETENKRTSHDMICILLGFFQM